MPNDRWNNDGRIGAVLALRRGYGFSSSWPAIVDAVQDYGRLEKGDHARRHNALRQIEAASGNWLNNYNRSRAVLVKALADQKYHALRGLFDCVGEEWAELSRLSRASAPASGATSAPVSTPTAPINIGGSGGSSSQRSAFAASTSPPDVTGVDKYGVWPQKKAEMRALSINHEDVEALYGQMDIQVHFTKNEHAQEIAAQGIRPGRGMGIGLPTDNPVERRSDNVNFYTLSGSSNETTGLVSREAGPRNVVVFSRKGSLNAYKDMNYPSGGARAVPGGTVPLGENTPLADNPVSLVLPLDERSAQNLSSFIRRVINAPTPPPEVHAAALLERYLQNKISRLRFY